MFPVWTSVIVTTKKHPRQGEAGHVSQINPVEFPDLCVVTFDNDGAEVSVNLADLKAL